MFDKPYKFDYLGAKNTLQSNPISKVLYRFQAKERRYLVTFEIYDFNVVAVKYCGLKDKDSSNRYELIYNDEDAIRVITTCLHTMKHYWQRNPAVTFAFYAVPRAFDENLVLNKDLTIKEYKIYKERYKKVRYNIYDYAMLNLFPPRTFIPIRDSKNALYLLMNRKQKKPATTVRIFGKYLLDNYELIFEPD
jgi:hypothetical protein